MLFEDKILIRTSPEKIFQFFEDMEQRYTEWHPDHVLFRWMYGNKVETGTVFYFEEYIAGKLLKKKVRFTRVEPNRYTEFAPTFWLMRLIIPRMSFEIEPQGEQCLFRARIHVRVGPIGARLNKKEFDAVRKHMREEGENIKRILESQ